MKNNSLKPSIRFKGFIKDWEQRKYGELGVPLSGGFLGYNSLDDENGKYKCVLYGDLYTKYDCVIKNIVHKTNVKGNSIIKNDILFPQSTTVDAYSLISPACLNENNAETSGVFVIRPNKDIDGNFVCYYTKGNSTQRIKLSKKAQGLTIIHLYYQSIKDETLFIPTFLEQKKISSLLMNLDNLIALNHHKAILLTNIKQSLLSKMFPINGESIPSIRFKGFSGDWEQRELSQFMDYTASSLSASDAKSEGQYDLYDANNLIGKIDQSPIKQDYISIIKDGAGVGRIRKLPKMSLFIGTMGGLLPNNSNLDFDFAILESRKLNEGFSGSTIPHIYFKDYGKKQYPIPEIKEQENIGSLFKNLDNLITLHQRKLDLLKNIKSSLLNKMFPN